jgi:alkyldihydroxyacetonephosphate synthase
MADAEPMKWWGWGSEDRTVTLPEPALTQLRGVLGAEARRADPVALDEVQIADPRLPQKVIEQFTGVLGDEWVRSDRLTRVRHAAGKSYPDLVRMRLGQAEKAPDAIVYPGTEDQVAAVLKLCGEHGVAVVPFGGGTSVVGGVEPVRGSFDSLIALDLERMTAVTAVDERSLTVELGPGLRGPQVESQLGKWDLTLGHFPQSFEFATLGGWVATRSAGQASTGYGKIEEMVVGVRCVTPSGEIESRPLPASAAGPQLRELLVGSEGVLGVITGATVKVRPRPATRRYEAWMFKGFSEGADAFRKLEQHEATPDVARLSDETETMLSMLAGGGSSLAQRAGRRYVKTRGYGGGCLAILGFEGDRDHVLRRRSQVARILRSAGALSLGTRPGKAWEHGRYDGPYLRDALLDNSIMVETLETAAQWSNLMDLYAAVGGALRKSLESRGTPPLVMCHVSHLYPNGASLYFTFFAAQEQGQELEQWRVAKSAACDAILGVGGTITHHHAIGTDHVPWMTREVGELGVGLLHSAKQRLDPAGIMNPGKLVPPEEKQKG